MKKWIDGDNCEVEKDSPNGSIGFLVECDNTTRGSETWSLRYRPAHTNQSREPRLSGWCGTTNDVAVYARGLARPVARHPGNDRVQVEALTDPDEIAEALESLGYPELIP